MTIGDLREWVEALPHDCDEEEIVVLFDNTIHDIAGVVYNPCQVMAFVECDPV